MQDLLSIMGDLVTLISERELEAAERMAASALRKGAAGTHEVRSAAVHEMNLQLQRIKRGRDALRESVQGLPEKERIFAQVQIEEVVEQIFTEEIAALKARKRKLSRPS